MPTPFGAAMLGNGPGVFGSHSGADGTIGVDSTPHQIEVQFRAPKAGNITQFGFWGSALGGGCVVESLITGVDANGHSDGVAAGGGAAYSHTVGGVGYAWRPDNADGTAFAVTAGTAYCYVLRWVSGTGSTGVDALFSETGGARLGAFVLRDAALYLDYVVPEIWFAYDDDESPLLSVNTGYTVEAWTPASNPDERGVAFTVAVPTVITAIGVTIQLSAASTCTVTLYDADGSTPLDQWSLAFAWKNARRVWLLSCDSDRTLSPGSTYRIAILPTAGTVSAWNAQYGAEAKAKAGALMHAAAFQRSTQNGGGGWTETDAADMLEVSVLVKSLSLAAAPSCSASSVAYSPWTRTGPNNPIWRLSFLAADGDNPVTTYHVWTGAGRTGTQVSTGAASAGSNSATIAYDAAGLADGDQTLYLSVDDGLGSVGSDCAFTLRRDDVDPTAATSVTVGAP